jgi:hypothetical protein
VFVPRLAKGNEVEFRIDTGADHTCLHPYDSRVLMIPFDLLDQERAVTGYGVGGGNRFFVESAQLVFDDAELGYEVRTIDLWIAEPNDGNRSLPSLLGLDVLRHWRMNFTPRNNLLQFFA